MGWKFGFFRPNFTTPSVNAMANSFSSSNHSMWETEAGKKKGKGK
jgi:hypothetical protein